MGSKEIDLEREVQAIQKGWQYLERQGGLGFGTIFFGPSPGSATPIDCAIRSRLPALCASVSSSIKWS